ncbi:MAG: hypothetical protein ACOYL9_08245 [Ilumatobacteraceae bacterium]
MSSRPSPVAAELGVVTVACSVHDEVFVMFVYDDGEVVVAGAVAGDDAGDEDMPVLRAEEIVQAVGRGDVSRDAVLSADIAAVERHERMASLLGLPVWPVGWGFEQLDDGVDGWNGPALTLVDV